MFKLRELRVRSLDVDYNEVSWKIEDTTADVLDYTIEVLRSESPSGPWDSLSPPFTDRYLFVDRSPPRFNIARTLHYLVRVTNKVSGETEDFGPARQEAEPDLIALELRRHMGLLFREFTGRRCYILPVRTFGQRCAACWNKQLNKKTRSGCRSCYDTGFARGYLTPIESFIQIDASNSLREQTTPLGAQQQQNTTARVADAEGIKPRDLIIEPENRRWRVVAVNQTEQVRAPIHMELQIHQIPQSDIEYAIELKLDDELRNLTLSPSRNFSNPQNLASASRDRDLMNLFPTFPKKPDSHG